MTSLRRLLQWLLSAPDRLIPPYSPLTSPYRRKIVSREQKVEWESGLVEELVNLECGHQVVVKYMRVEMIECAECECQKKP